VHWHWLGFKIACQIQAIQPTRVFLGTKKEKEFGSLVIEMKRLNAAESSDCSCLEVSDLHFAAARSEGASGFATAACCA
jgi:hypothetical protein